MLGSLLIGTLVGLSGSRWIDFLFQRIFFMMELVLFDRIKTTRFKTFSKVTKLMLSVNQKTERHYCIVKNAY